jgi:RHS repeat-associated protein
VFYEGKAAAMFGDTAMMCCDPSDMPVGKVMGTAATVEIGGGGQGSDADRALASALAMIAAAAKCYAWIAANMPPGAARDQAERDVCAATGHPVDVVTGKVFTHCDLVALPGRIPLGWNLDYSTARHCEDGPFGYGWRHSLEAALHVEVEFVAYRDAHGRFVAFPPVAVGGAHVNTGAGLTLARPAGGPWTVTDRAGLRQVFTADPARPRVGRLTAIEDRFGNRIRLDYDGPRLGEIVDTADRRLVLRHGPDGRVERVDLHTTSTQMPIASFEYAAGGELVAVLHGPAAAANAGRDGVARRYEYDGRLLVRETDRNGFSFYFQYDADARCIRTWGDGGLFYRDIAYDPVRRLTRVTDSRGSQMVYRGTAAGVADWRVDALGNESAWQWDDAGHMTAQSYPNGTEWSYAYDESGLLVGITDPEGGETKLTRDVAGRIIELVRPDGRSMTSRWDDERGVIVGQTDEDGVEYRYAYSAAGDLTEVWSDGRLVDRFTYDAAGNRTRREGFGVATSYGYDELGRLTEVRDAAGDEGRIEHMPLGTGGARRMTIGERVVGLEYDAEGNLLVAGDGGAALRLSDYRWNAPGHRTAGNLTVRYEMDNELALTAIRLEGFGTHAWTFDEVGRATSHRVPWATGPYRYERDAGGVVLAVTDPAGRRAELDRDPMGRVTRRQVDGGRPTKVEYGPEGRITRAAGPDVTVSTELDDNGRAKAETWEWVDPPRTAEWSLSQDEGGALVLDEQELFGYQRLSDDDGSRFAAITSPLWPRPLAFSYPHDGVAVTRFPNGVTETLETDRRGRWLNQTLAAPDGRLIGQRDYKYDAGRLVRCDDSVRGSWDYGYDADRRLTRVGPPTGGIAAFQYDALSNLQPAGAGWRISEAGQLVEADGYRYAYDALGNRTARSGPDGNTSYVYDDQSQLSRVRLPDGRAFTYQYDALGRRSTRIDAAGEHIHCVWQGDRLLAELHPGGQRRIYVHMPQSVWPVGWVDLVLSDDAPADVNAYFVHTDQRGLPLDVTDADGQVVWSADVDPFGRLVRTFTSNVECPFRMLGQHYDAETGLHYNRYRFYDPSVARYLTPDPTGLEAGLNPYRYCLDPLMRSDPLGLSDAESKRCRLACVAAAERAYNGSPALQLLSKAFNERDPARQAELLKKAEQMLAKDHGITIIDWTKEMTNRRERDTGEGVKQHNPLLHDPGMALYDQRLILRDPRVTGKEKVEETAHEAGAILIADQNPGAHKPGEAGWKEGIPMDGRRPATHDLDDRVRSDGGKQPLESEDARQKRQGEARERDFARSGPSPDRGPRDTQRMPAVPPPDDEG